MRAQQQKWRGERLRVARRQAKLSQRQVAEHMKCSRQLIGSIESGNSDVTAAQLADLCVLYGCSPNFVLFGTQQSADGNDAAVLAERLNGLDPALCNTMLMLYRVFVRRGATDPAGISPLER